VTVAAVALYKMTNCYLLDRL